MSKQITTFIIPSINRPTLNRAIKSAKDAQRHVNDGVSIPEACLYEVDTERKGESYIRNKLVREANTPYVSFLDDDDTVTADYVEKLELEINNFKSRGIEPDLIVFREYFIAEFMDTPMEDHFIWQKPEVKWGEIGIAFTVKREIALKIPFVEEEHEDLHFVERVQEAGYNVLFSPYIVYHGRH